jgi:hypothetical protein
MPKLSERKSSQVTKLLLVGDSGAGKTGALASLAQAGYQLKILDFDNGLDVLENILSGKRSAQYIEPLAITLTDPMKKDLVSKKLVPGIPTVWTRMVEQFMGNGDKEFGGLGDQTPKDVLVLDSLSFLGKACMNFVLSMNSRLGGRPTTPDWGLAQDYLESALASIYDENVNCNVVVNCHITYIGEKDQPKVGYPEALGKALPSKIGRYFNSVLQVKTSGFGAAARREIHTTTTGLIELKNTAPLKVAKTYPIETGLADYFRDVRQGGAPTP